MTTSHAAVSDYTAYAIGSTDAPYGYYEYLPPGYDPTARWPLLIYLHGIGNEGGGTIEEMPTVLTTGMPRIVVRDEWPETHPFVLIVPQRPNSHGDIATLDEFIEYLIGKYAVDAGRVYMAGQSAGGAAVFNYVATHPQKIAAAVPLGGQGTEFAQQAACGFTDTRLWAFHGFNDNVYTWTGPAAVVSNYNACPGVRVPAKLTVYSERAHAVWGITCDLEGMAEAVESAYDPYDVDLYTWLLQADLTPPQAPTVTAGADRTLVEGEDVELEAEAGDADGAIVSWSWVQTSGPDVAVAGADTATLSIASPPVGHYVFEVSVTDDEDLVASDAVTVDVMPLALSTTTGTGAQSTGTSGTSGSGTLADTGGGPVTESGTASTGRGSWPWEATSHGAGAADDTALETGGCGCSQRGSRGLASALVPLLVLGAAGCRRRN